MRVPPHRERERESVESALQPGVTAFTSSLLEEAEMVDATRSFGGCLDSESRLQALKAVSPVPLVEHDLAGQVIISVSPAGLSSARLFLFCRL